MFEERNMSRVCERVPSVIRMPRTSSAHGSGAPCHNARLLSGGDAPEDARTPGTCSLLRTTAPQYLRTPQFVRRGGGWGI